MTSTRQQRQYLLEVIADLVGYGTSQQTNWDTFQQRVLSDKGQDEYTFPVVNDALEWLSEKGYITRRGAMQHPWLRLGLTIDGKDHLEDGGDLTILNKPDPVQTTNNFTFNAQTNFQQGDGNVQNIHFGVSEQQVVELIKALQAEGSPDLAEEINQSTQGGKDPHMVFGFFGRIIEKIASSASTTATQAALTSLLPM